MMATNLLSQGVPMMLSGDECRRTQQGNNNAYCQDNPISWFDWRLVQRNEPLIRFVAALVDFRRREPTVRRTDFLSGQPARPGELPDVSWFSPLGDAIDWSHSGNSLTCLLAAAPRLAGVGPELPAVPNHHILILAHSGGSPQKFVFPKVARTFSWWQFINTAAAPPKDIIPNWTAPPRPPTGRSSWRAARWYVT